MDTYVYTSRASLGNTKLIVASFWNIGIIYVISCVPSEKGRKVRCTPLPLLSDYIFCYFCLFLFIYSKGNSSRQKQV